MCKRTPLVRLVYQWQTCTGAVAHEFSTTILANEWMTNNLRAGKHDVFYKSLQLVKVETTIVESIIVPAINPM